MPDFSNFRALDIKDKTANYVIADWLDEPKPVLVVVPAGNHNPAYLNAAMRAFGPAAQSKRISLAEDLARTRKVNRQLFPAYIVKGWENIVDNAGAPVPFSKEACSDLLEVLPDHILDDLARFCSSTETFLDVPEVDVEAVAGN